MLDQTKIESIKNHFSIVEFIGRYVQLKKRGINYIGNCPFHNEKTPSFTVSPDKNIWHCFGCGTGGNLFNFLMKIENLEFMEAVKRLAEEAGIDISDSFRNKEEIDKEKRLYQLNQQALEFFQKSMNTNTRDYFTNRGLSSETINEFHLGFAPDSWDGLKNSLAMHGEQTLITMGLIIKNEKGKIYDRFRNRAMFPIYSVSGNVIAFGGRALDPNDQVKYINSPDTPIYNKGENIYALNIAKIHINKEGYALLMEGYMDVIAAHQAGIKTAVASLGTALTIKQARLLKRFTKKVIISYDGDNAGQIAIERAIEVLAPLALDIGVIQIPAPAKDPDDFLKANGADAFQELINNAQPYIKFKLDRIINSFTITLPEEKDKAVSNSVAFLKGLSPVLQEEYTSYLAQKLKLNKNTISSYLGNSRKGVVRSSKKYIPKPKNKFEEAEKILIYSALEDIEIRQQLQNLPEELLSNNRRETLKYIAASDKTYEEIEAQLVQDNQKELLSEITNIRLEFDNIDENETKHAFDTIHNKKIELTEDALKNEMIAAEKVGDEIKAMELLEKIIKLRRT